MPFFGCFFYQNHIYSRLNYTEMPFLDITLGQYYSGSSFIHRLDPRTKLMASILLMTCLLFAESFKALSVYLCFTFLLKIVSGLPNHVLLKSLKPFGWLLGFTMLFHSINFSAENTIFIGFDFNALLKGSLYAIRLVILIVLAMFLTSTTEPVELTDGLGLLLAPLRRLRAPVDDLVLMSALTLRFVPILLEEAINIKNAQISRGLSLEGKLLNRIQALVPMIIPLLFQAFRRAEALALAMEARAYSSLRVRSSFKRMRFRFADYGSFMICAGVGCLGVYLG